MTLYRLRVGKIKSIALVDRFWNFNAENINNLWLYNAIKSLFGGQTAASNEIVLQQVGHGVGRRLDTRLYCYIILSSRVSGVTVTVNREMHVLRNTIR